MCERAPREELERIGTMLRLDVATQTVMGARGSNGTAGEFVTGATRN